MKTIEIGLLEWQEEDDGIQRTWDEAMDYANGLGNGWRLPTIEELISIIDFESCNPACKIQNCVSYYYWSSSPYAGDSSLAWGASFLNGPVYYGQKGYHNYTRCVREVIENE